MRRRFTSGLLALGLAAVLGGALPDHVAQARPLGYAEMNNIQRRILSGLSAWELARGIPATSNLAASTDTGTVGGEGADHGSDAPDGGAVAAPDPASAGSAGAPKNYTPSGHDSCAGKIGSNVKVNQNCLNLTDPDLQGRGQAQNETAIAGDPNKKDRLVASYNDYRRGDGTCGVSYSNDNGGHWSDATVPNGFTRGDAFGAARQYWQAGGDTSVAFDTKGNAYLACQLFMRGMGNPQSPTTTNPDLSSAFYVFRSTANGGASWNFPGRPVAESPDTAGTGMSDFLDKEYLTVDNHAGSPFQDRIYVTWTTFSSDGSAYVYESYSNDYGETFSAPVVVSNDSPLCTNNYGAGTTHGNCNENQFSDPFTGPDGNLYVVWDNYNNTVSGNDNRNQVLLAKSTNGGQSFSPPVKVSDYYDLPDCATYQGGQDAGRACVPEHGSNQYSVFRATNYPVGQVNPSSPSEVSVTLGSYINKHSNESTGCVPNGIDSSTGQDLYTGVKTPACNNDILLSVSKNSGASFTGTTTDPRNLASVNQDPGQATSDQFWQWSSYNKDGKKLAVSYYDRQYGSDETSGSSDVTLSGSKDLTAFKAARITSSSMPAPTEFPDSQGNSLFYGDYAGLWAWDDGTPFWSDTRDPDLFRCPSTGAPGVCTASEPNGRQANDQDVFTDHKGIPS